MTTTYTPTDLTSGALLLERVKLGQGNQCSNEQCTRMGRFRIRIAGHYVSGPTKAQRYSFLCSPCGKEANRIWDEMTGRAEVEAPVERVAA